MDKKIQLEILKITNSKVQTGAFALVLGEVSGDRHLPIIIGPTEAQAIILHLQGVKMPRPLTHDLFMASIDALGTILLRVLIYKVQEGVFYSYIYLKNGENTLCIDARTSDAIALAMRAESPIFIYESILEQECLHMSNPEENGSNSPSLPKTSPLHIEENIYENKVEDRYLPYASKIMCLLDSLDQAIKDEDYERAAKIRDEINSRHGIE